MSDVPPLQLVCDSACSSSLGYSLSADPSSFRSEDRCAGGGARDRQGDAHELHAVSSSCGPCARSPTLTPRMRAVYERTSVRPHPLVCNVNDAVVMPPNILGRKTEALRRIALRESVDRDRASRLSNAAAAPAMASSASSFAVVSSSHQPGAVPAVCRHGAIASSALVVRGNPPRERGGSSAGTRPMSAYEAEGAQIAVEAERLLNSVPDAMLLYGRSAGLPADVRRANLRSTISRYDAGTISKGRAAIDAWLQFCERHALADCGAPFDADHCVWFLREEDERARARASSADSSSKRTGASVQHARACALRWLSAVGCVPFAAHDLQVRKSAPPDASREPGMTAMWEVAVARHLLIIAVRYDGPRASLVRPYAAAAYIMCIASLRQLDALRSQVPCLTLVEGIPSFSGVASYTKGHNTRARQRPMPWWVPAASVEPSIDDATAASALHCAFSELGGSAPSMFTEVVGPEGHACTLATAVHFGSIRARPEHLTGSVSYLLTWSPLSYPADRAKTVAAGRHGPRHMLPEVARVLGMPAEARDELGRWKDGGGRLQRHANRYSREGERLMQVALRLRLVHRIRSVIAESYSTSTFEFLPLSSFAARGDEDMATEQSVFAAARQQCLLLAPH